METPNRPKGPEQLPSDRSGADAYVRVRSAVLSRTPISAVYSGLRRKLCPHAIGLKNGDRVGLFYQFGGESRAGLDAGGQWRTMRVDRLGDVRELRGRWRSADDYDAHVSAFDVIDVEVAPQPADVGTVAIPRAVEELVGVSELRRGVAYVDVAGNRWVVADDRCYLCGGTALSSQELTAYYCSRHGELSRVALTIEHRRRIVWRGDDVRSSRRASTFVLLPSSLSKQQVGEVLAASVDSESSDG